MSVSLYCGYGIAGASLAEEVPAVVSHCPKGRLPHFCHEFAGRSPQLPAAKPDDLPLKKAIGAKIAPDHGSALI
ncbi:hypothetical protein [Brucella pseudintermedia]|uniref:hypothetical protein n=1 Tax=Brucella pseudintermedia TaxID=370111 RepID=UPI00158CDE35|nr:hypothetical protein [Brucella pseudintermedia]